MPKRRKKTKGTESRTIGPGTYYLSDCIEGAKLYLESNSVDLVITDPPYGINGDRLHQHYNRDERFIVGDYVEVDPSEYAKFSSAWIKQLERVLKPGGSAYIVSGYTNLYHILAALRKTSLREVNHIIWKYNFGVFTRNKFVSSHYHILYYEKPGGKRAFHLQSRYGLHEKAENGVTNYEDREDVWRINREYQPQRRKNKNSLPRELLCKMMQYSSSPGDLVCDFFLGGFSTAKVAVGLNRRFVGFEVSRHAFLHHVTEMEAVTAGGLLATAKRPAMTKTPEKQWEPWSQGDLARLKREFNRLKAQGDSKKRIVERLMAEFGRGMWSIEHTLKRLGLRYRH